jgi:hypothetical protein
MVQLRGNMESEALIAQLYDAFSSGRVINMEEFWMQNPNSWKSEAIKRKTN